MKSTDGAVKAAELKPCPCCNGEAVLLQTSRQGMTVKCKECRLQITGKVLKFSLGWLSNKLIETWNKRSHLTPTPTPKADRLGEYRVIQLGDSMGGGHVLWHGETMLYNFEEHKNHAEYVRKLLDHHISFVKEKNANLLNSKDQEIGELVEGLEIVMSFMEKYQLHNSWEWEKDDTPGYELLRTLLAKHKEKTDG